MKHWITVLTLLTLLLCSAFLIAQESRATVSGVVTDPSGAAIPNARITATEVRTGVKSSTVSDGAGQYTLPFLPPGQYEIQVEEQGYRPFVRKAVQVNSGDHPVIDATLQIGAANDVVTVTADTPLLDTANASTGQTISTKEVEDIPLNGRNPMMVAQLAIGVIATANPTLVHPFDNGAASAWSIGGTPSQTAEIMMDGAPNATWDNRVAYAPPQEAVQEVKVKAFDTDASYGHTGSGTINKVMKTGTNDLHGSVYGFTQPSWLAANNFFSNRAGIPVQSTKLNQYGLTAGGPIVRSKLFWFFAFEKLDDSQPNTKFLTVPTDAERQGDFSSLLKLGSNFQIYNPYTGTTSGSNIVRKPFMCDASGNALAPNLTPGANFGTQATGTPCNKIPQQLLNPVALAYLKFYPEPNVAGANTGFSNFGNSATTNDKYDNEIGRINWDMSDRSHLSVNFRHNYQLQSKNNYFNNNAHGLASNLNRINWGSTADEVYTLNNSTVLDVRLNYTRMNERHPSPMAGFDPTSLGFPSYVKGSSQFLQLPMITFGSCGNDTTQATSFDCLGQTGADILPSESYSIFGDVSKQLNKHSLKFGVDTRRYKLDAQQFGASVGSYTFGTGWTQSASNGTAAPFGQDFASFLLGLPTAGTYNLSARGTYTENYYALFINDDWRVKNNLTLNIGLRFDRDLPYSEKLGRTVNGFDFGATSPVSDAAVAAFNSKTKSKLPFPINFASVPGGVTFASQNDPSIWQNSSHLISPRIGLAWTPDRFNQKTVLRAGFGLFVQPIALSNLNPTGGYSSTPILTQEGFSQSTTISFPSNFSSPVSTPTSPVSTLSNPFPIGFTQPPGSSLGLATFMGQNVDFFPSQQKNPYSERWTLGIQQELARNLLMEIAYIGNHSVHLPMSVTQLNGVPRQFLSTLPYRDAALNSALTASVPNPFAGLLPGTNLNGTNTTVSQLLAPFPQYPVAVSSSQPTFSSGVTERNAPLGSSYFNSLNVRVEQRSSHGLQVVENFIWSKLMERDSWLNNTDARPEKRISPFDHTLRFVTAVNYDLPVGRGRPLNIQSRLLDEIVGGWSVNGIYTYQTGAPILFLNGSTNNPGDYALCSVPTVSGACPNGPNGVPQAAIFIDPTSLNMNARQTNGPAFDISRFVTASAQQFQFHLRTFPTTLSALRQDPQNNFDASVIKRFDITERTYFQFRFEAFNVLNRAVFAAPNLTATNAQFGIINSTANRPRQVQVGARFVF
jgi:carboxypeptidase family protein